MKVLQKKIMIAFFSMSSILHAYDLSTCLCDKGYFPEEEAANLPSSGDDDTAGSKKKKDRKTIDPKQSNMDEGSLPSIFSPKSDGGKGYFPDDEE